MKTNETICDLRFAICDLGRRIQDLRLKILNPNSATQNRKSQIANRKFFVIIFCFLPLFFSTVNSQEIPPAQNFHQWGAVTLFSGLPSDNVRAITQTADGVLWFGTDNGLARFDGRRVQTVPLEGLETNKILTLAVAPTGEIWVGAERGAGRFYDGKFHPIRETLGKPITAILLGEISTLVSSDTIYSAHHNPDNSLDVIMSNNRPLEFKDVVRFDGNLLFGSRGRGLIIEQNGELQEVSSRPRPYFINALRLSANGDLWIGAQADKSGSGLFWARDIFRPVRLKADVGTVTAISAAETADVWVGTEKRGLFRFRGEQQIEHFTFENTAGGLRSDTIYSIFSDREGVLWVGTNRGASRFDASSPFSQIISDESPNSNFVRTIYQTKSGQILAGTNRGLFTFSDGGWIEAKNFAGKTVYAVGEDSSAQLLIGASTGVFNQDGKQKMAGDIRAFAVFQGRTYAAVFGRGIVSLDGENQTVIFPNETANALFAEAEKLWIGTTKGDVFTFNGKETKPENALQNLRGAAIRKITKDADGNLWFGGERGLFRFKDGELQNVIDDRDVRDVLIIGAEIWAATVNGGLVHVRRDNDFGWLSVALDVEQGLPSEQIFALLQQDNRLLIGTNRGVVSYAPSRNAPQIIAARVLSQRLHAAEELWETIKLEYPQNSLLVEVAGLSSRTFPEQFQYAFFLKNASGEILDKKLSSDAQYAPANLAAGEYRVEARAFNKDLLASEPLTINFSVDREPFPWTATALGGLLAVAIIALIWAGIERRRISQRNRQLAAARFDLANEAERERRRIARDLHDQTLADLRNLMMMSDKLPTDNSDFRAEIESVSTEIRRICEDLSPSVLENVGLTPALEFLVSHTIENYEFSAAESVEERLNFSPNAQMQIYRIAQEVLSNIKRHSDASAVKMRIEISEAGEFILSISDNGTAFAPTENAFQRGRGISNIKSRAALIEADVFWQKGENGDTLFQLKKRSEPPA